jgi:hypothetical protein
LKVEEKEALKGRRTGKGLARSGASCMRGGKEIL